MTEPLTPPECDLRNFPGMMVDVTRLLGSKFNLMASRNPLAWMVGHKLWYRAWHQVPAASLPDDDDELCQLAELGFDIKTWRKVKDIALHGWQRCSDGRLYHSTVAEVALEAWIDKLGQQLSSGAGNAKRHGSTFDPAPIHEEIRRAAQYLERIDPKSRRLKKQHVQKAKSESVLDPAGPPDKFPPGARPEPASIPPGSHHTVSNPTNLRGEEPDGPSLRRKGSRLSSDWKPSQAETQFAFNAGLTIEEINHEAAQFVDYWCSRGDRGACKIDWSRTWQGRCREVAQRKADRLGRFTNLAGRGADERRTNT